MKISGQSAKRHVQHDKNTTVVPRTGLINGNKGVFSWWKILDSVTVALSFVFSNQCPIMD